ncbi:MAG: ABC transporter permease [Clostridium sp.]|uniref:ABC transporter permease n=1 Tax=Clostridium sp. TaxID=1506 RepID=UPI003D6D093F
MLKSSSKCTVLKNEIIKIISANKFYIILLSILSSVILMAIVRISFKAENSSVSLSVQTFLKSSLNGILIKPLLPIFMIIIVAEIFSEDYAQGTMKFSLLTPIKKKDLIIGKLAFIALYSAVLIIFSFIACYIIGILFFGFGDRNTAFDSLITNIKLYAVLILPLISFSMIMSLIAMFIKGTGAMIGAGIGIYFIMIFIDMGIKNAMYYTFSGGLLAFDLVGNDPNMGILKLIISAIVYIILALIANVVVIKKKDILL